MLTTRILVLALALPVQSHPVATPQNLPKEWPPLPDFKTRIDYVKWLEDQVSPELRKDNAASLWEALSGSSDDPEQRRKARDEMWGYDSRDELPGLFTGMKPIPDRYAWDPKDHPDWERAFQAQEEHRLRERIMEAVSRRVCANLRSSCSLDPGGGQGGITADDNLLYFALYPSMASHRQASRVLMQNAWRAPGGILDVDRMSEAITACLRISRQLEQGTRGGIEYLVAFAIRSLAYTSAIHVLEEGRLSRDQVSRIARDLSQYDPEDVGVIEFQACWLAGWFDILQFAYQLDPDATEPPSPDMNHLRRLSHTLQVLHEQDRSTGGVQKPPLDLVGEIGKCDASTALRQIIDLQLKTRELGRTKLPQDAAAACDELLAAFERDPSTHVLWRQFALDVMPGRQITIRVKCEATRRATHLLYSLHRQQKETGKWPATLRELQGLAPKYRTDPFSGKDFIYRVDGSNMTLYSAGVNAMDDGGIHDEFWGEEFNDDKPVAKKADYVFWPIPPRKR